MGDERGDEREKPSDFARSAFRATVR